jgi:hypothetical protein
LIIDLPHAGTLYTLAAGFQLPIQISVDSTGEGGYSQCKWRCDQSCRLNFDAACCGYHPARLVSPVTKLNVEKRARIKGRLKFRIGVTMATVKEEQPLRLPMSGILLSSLLSSYPRLCSSP